MSAEQPGEIDLLSPPASIALEWCQHSVELNSVKGWQVHAATLADDDLEKAATAINVMWSLVDPLSRWLMANWLEKDSFLRPGRASALDAIRGTEPPPRDRPSRATLINLSEQYFRRDEDPLSKAAPAWPVHARVATGSLPDRVVAAIEEEFLELSDSPDLLLVDEYVCVQLVSLVEVHEFLMSRRGPDWFIVLWPSLWRRAPGLLPPQPSGPGGDPAGVREPSAPHPPHAEGGAALPLPED